MPQKAQDGFRKYVPFMDRDYNLFMLLGLALTGIFKARHNQVRALGLTPTEFHLLLLVAELGEDAYPAEISRWMMRKPPTTSRLLDRMEKSGLVRRVSRPGNRKVKRVVMTPRGREVLERARGPDVLRRIMAGLSEEELGTLWRLLEKLKDSAFGQAEAMRKASPSP